MEINTTTILKSILGSVIHFTKALQVEKRIKDSEARIISYNLINNQLKSLFEIKDDNKFIEELDNLINIYSKENKPQALAAVLRIKEIYKDINK
jgi:hypothetical protein